MLEGMSASANIMIESVDNALLIPADALNKTSAAFYVYTAYDEENGLGGMVEVTTGISNSSYVEIKDGLAEGDTVYYKDTQSSGWMNFSMPGGRNFGGDSSSGGSFPAAYAIGRLLPIGYAVRRFVPIGYAIGRFVPVGRKFVIRRR